MKKPPLYTVLTETLGENIFKDATILDVGAYKCLQSAKMRDMGAKVVALDINNPEEIPENVRFVKGDFLTWEADQKFDIVYMSNVALFMPTIEVLKKLEKISPKIIVVRTMYDDTVPSWDAIDPRKKYWSSPEEWSNYFEQRGYKTALVERFEQESFDFKGNKKIYRFVDYIGNTSDK